MNAIAGFARSIILRIHPGTAPGRGSPGNRDRDGWPVRLSDTAGLRDTADPLESEGVHRTRVRRRRSADLVIGVFDLSRPPEPTDRELLAELPETSAPHREQGRPPPLWPESELRATPPGLGPNRRRTARNFSLESEPLSCRSFRLLTCRCRSWPRGAIGCPSGRARQGRLGGSLSGAPPASEAQPCTPTAQPGSTHPKRLPSRGQS